MGKITIRQPQAVLQRSEARQIPIDYWMGHCNPSMGDRYDRRGLQTAGNIRNNFHLFPPLWSFACYCLRVSCEYSVASSPKWRHALLAPRLQGIGSH